MDAISQNANFRLGAEVLKPPRVVIYLVDNGTSGPIARAAKMARQLKEAGADVSVLMPSKHMHSPFFAPDIHQVRYEGNRIWRPSKLNPQWQIARMHPDMLLVDEYPFVAQEHAKQWEAVIDVAKRVNRSCEVHGMSCDIPIYYKDAESSNIAKRAKRMDHIWVTGDPSITDFSEYVAPEAMPHVAPKLDYVGFMNEAPAGHVDDSAKPKGAQKEVLVYLGGGNVARFASRYISLLANMPLLSKELQQAHWRFVMPEEYDSRHGSQIQNMLSSLPEELQENISLEQTDTHFKEKLQRADMVVTGGGQSAIESVLVEGKPTVILPAFFGEQFARAKDFAARFPEQVAAADLPTIKFPVPTGKRLRYNMIAGIVEKDWVTRTLEWAETKPECEQMRDSMEKVFAASGKDHPRPQIMLDGAQHIAAEMVATQHAPAKDGWISP